MTSFAIYHLKGGVGKTTSCINLAYLAAAEGYRTLLWDLDAQSASTFYLDRKGGLLHDPGELIDLIDPIEKVIVRTDYDNLFLVPGDLKNRKLDILLHDANKSKSRLKKILKILARDYDYVFIDCPPTLNLIAENLFKAAHFVLLPMIPSTLSERTFQQVHQFMDRHGYDRRKIFSFFNLVDRRKRLHQETITTFRERNGNKVLRAAIPYSAVVERMGLEQAPLPTFAPSSVPTQRYRDLWQEMKMMRKYKE